MKGRKPVLMTRGHRTKAEIARRSGPGFSPAADIDIPESLAGDAADLWRRIAPELLRVGVLREVSIAGLVGMCQAYGLAMQADREIAVSGIVVENDGRSIQNPACRVSSDCWNRFRLFALEFGVLPSAEGRVGQKQNDETDEIEALMSA
jgi:P27 family predicted phage terminase small subunit